MFPKRTKTNDPLLFQNWMHQSPAKSLSIFHSTRTTIKAERNGETRLYSDRQRHGWFPQRWSNRSSFTLLSSFLCLSPRNKYVTQSTHSFTLYFFWIKASHNGYDPVGLTCHHNSSYYLNSFTVIKKIQHIVIIYHFCTTRNILFNAFPFYCILLHIYCSH